MPDMLVKLYDLSVDQSYLVEQDRLGITIRKPFGPERFVLIDWVREHFSDHWASEVAQTLASRPISCLVAVRERQFVGFSCYDCTSLGMFGPIGTAEASRGKGTGKALLLATLHDMRLRGYSYAIIGNVGPVAFYEKLVGATIIPDSDPGYLRTWVRND